MYNSLSLLPTIPYNIMTYLATQDEIIWKLLKYNDYGALSHENLSFSEKMDLVWKTGPQESFGVFLTPVVGDAIPESKTILKVYDYYVHASQLYMGTVVYSFDILYGVHMALVEYQNRPVSRADLMINRLLAVLNGANIGGVGKMVFSDDMSRYDLARSVIGNSKTFTGAQLFLSVMVGDSGEDEGCVS